MSARSNTTSTCWQSHQLVVLRSSHKDRSLAIARTGQADLAENERTTEYPIHKIGMSSYYDQVNVAKLLGVILCLKDIFEDHYFFLS